MAMSEMAASEMALSDRPAERHREVAGAFAERVRGTRDWNAPSPVAGWTAHSVVEHLTTWFPAFLAGGAGIDLPKADPDPVVAWQAQTDAVQDLLERPGDRVLSNPHIGDVPLAEAIDRFYTADVFMHTWDLARATGQDDRLDQDFCAQLLAGMLPMADVLVASGQYGPPVPVPDDADPQTKLIAFIGRDPAWRRGGVGRAGGKN